MDCSAAKYVNDLPSLVSRQFAISKYVARNLLRSV
jgi:hypothetical protein